MLCIHITILPYSNVFNRYVKGVGEPKHRSRESTFQEISTKQDVDLDTKTIATCYAS